MATERQIAANRRNAQKSTGPRSAAAKRRVSRNALRHGLSVPLLTAEHVTKEVEELAQRLAEGDTREKTLSLARQAAEAVLDLARVRRVRVAMIEEERVLRVDVAVAEPHRTFEAMRRVMPQQTRLDRYEFRAAARRDRAMLAICEAAEAAAAEAKAGAKADATEADIAKAARKAAGWNRLPGWRRAAASFGRTMPKFPKGFR